MDILINHKGKLYMIAKEPFETNEDCYKRGWYIIKNYDSNQIDKVISLSILNNNTKKGMTY
jgi:hypothetical protein